MPHRDTRVSQVINAQHRWSSELRVSCSAGEGVEPPVRFGLPVRGQIPRFLALQCSVRGGLLFQIPALTYHIYKTIFIRNQYLRNQYIKLFNTIYISHVYTHTYIYIYILKKSVFIYIYKYFIRFSKQLPTDCRDLLYPVATYHRSRRDVVLPWSGVLSWSGD